MELMLTLLQQCGSHQGVGLDHPPSSFMPQRQSKRTGKIDKDLWMSLLVAIGDSQQFMEMVRGLRWEEGLSTVAVQIIKSRLSTAHSGSEWGVAGGAKRSGSGREQLITVSMARHASESAASMCIFAVSIVHYHQQLETFKKAHTRAERLRRDLASEQKRQVERDQS